MRCLVPLLVFAAVAAQVALAESHRDGALRPPVRRSAPRITGRPLLGELLRARRGRWIGAAALRITWKRCNAQGAACTSILHVDRHGPRDLYRIKKADVGHRLRVTIVAINGAGRRVANSPATP